MRPRIVFTTLTALIITVATAGAAPQPDFSGEWELVADKSTGIPPGMTQSMSVKQAGDRIEVQIKLGGPSGERTTKDVYVVNGKETEFTPIVMEGGKPKNGKRTSKWQTEASGFDVTEEATIESPEGSDTIKGTRTWRLSPDGKELTIDMDLRGEQAEIKSKRVFVRK